MANGYIECDKIPIFIFHQLDAYHPSMELTDPEPQGGSGIFFGTQERGQSP